MKTCSEGHKKIEFKGDTCPCCVFIEKIEDLEYKIKCLKIDLTQNQDLLFEEEKRGEELQEYIEKTEKLVGQGRRVIFTYEKTLVELKDVIVGLEKNFQEYNIKEKEE